MNNLLQLNLDTPESNLKNMIRPYEIEIDKIRDDPNYESAILKPVSKNMLVKGNVYLLYNRRKIRQPPNEEYYHFNVIIGRYYRQHRREKDTLIFSNVIELKITSEYDSLIYESEDIDNIHLLHQEEINYAEKKDIRNWKNMNIFEVLNTISKKRFSRKELEYEKEFIPEMKQTIDELKYVPSNKPNIHWVGEEYRKLKEQKIKEGYLPVTEDLDEPVSLKRTFYNTNKGGKKTKRNRRNRIAKKSRKNKKY